MFILLLKIFNTLITHTKIYIQWVLSFKEHTVLQFIALIWEVETSMTLQKHKSAVTKININRYIT